MHGLVLGPPAARGLRPSAPYKGIIDSPGSDRSVSLYSRDDILPMLRLQRLVVDAVRSGFRPLQPMARGLNEPLPDFPVVLPSSNSLPELGPLSADCLPEALPSRPCLPIAPLGIAF